MDVTLSTVAWHFKQFYNMNPAGLQFWAMRKIDLGIRKGNIEQELLRRESNWIFQLNTISPHGINEKIYLMHSYRYIVIIYIR